MTAHQGPSEPLEQENAYNQDQGHGDDGLSGFGKVGLDQPNDQGHDNNRNEEREHA